MTVLLRTNSECLQCTELYTRDHHSLLYSLVHRALDTLAGWAETMILDSHTCLVENGGCRWPLNDLQHQENKEKNPPWKSHVKLKSDSELFKEKKKRLISQVTIC